MSATDQALIVIYAILYVSLSAATLIYLRKKGASRKIQFWAFLGITVAFVGRVLQGFGLMPTIDHLFEAIGSIRLRIVAMYLVFMGVFGPVYYYFTKSLRGVVLFAAAYALMFFFPYPEGVSDTVRSALFFAWGVVVVGLILSAGVVTYSDYQNWRNRDG